MRLYYDGHGLNDDSEYRERVLTFASKPNSDGGGYRLDRKAQDATGERLAACYNALTGLDPAGVAPALEALKAVAGESMNPRLVDKARAALAGLRGGGAR